MATPESAVGGLFPRERRTLAPGAVHVPDWLTLEQQQELVKACRGWARGPVPMWRATTPGGQAMSVQTVTLGWYWLPYRYSRTADDRGGAAVEPMPDWLIAMGKRAVADAYEDPAAGEAYTPDSALINFYDEGAKMGMHQDDDEHDARAPVVSLSLGNRCLFRFGNLETRAKPYIDVDLCSGDLFVFGRESRLAFHGVPKTFPSTADPRVGITTGRLNITLRDTGMDRRR
ncbi:MAG: alpha-ketoglutarate-dependent dioxygenase AlkB [Solirubrobacteraceae bacterium]|nr:alpha-ketoglutarate-dependent dioxygenase AlkB [Solirubrobacteraceae bacterium]